MMRPIIRAADQIGVILQTKADLMMEAFRQMIRPPESLSARVQLGRPARPAFPISDVLPQVQFANNLQRIVFH